MVQQIRMGKNRHPKSKLIREKERQTEPAWINCAGSDEASTTRTFKIILYRRIAAKEDAQEHLFAIPVGGGHHYQKAS